MNTLFECCEEIKCNVLYVFTTMMRKIVSESEFIKANWYE